MREEIVPGDRAVWQSEHAKTYRCPVCTSPVFSTYEGELVPLITCLGVGRGHSLVWLDAEVVDGEVLVGEIHPAPEKPS